MSRLEVAGIEPGIEAHAFARKNGRIEWPIREETVIGNALLLTNSLGINRVPTAFLSHDGVPAFVDHLLVARTDPNAVATRHGQRYITAVNTGLYLNCIDTSFSILSAREALPAIGDSKAERPAIPNAVLGRAAARFPSPKAFFDHLSTHQPRCPTRRAVAHLLSIVMLTFLYRHEEGHVMLGHVDYAIARKRDGGVEERRQAHESAGADRAFRHLRELDADRWAFVSTLVPAFIDTLGRNYETTLRLSHRQWIAVAWLGAALLGGILADLDDSPFLDPGAWESHPHGLLRARQILVPTLARSIMLQTQDEDYLEAFADTWEHLIALGDIWPQYRFFKYLLHLHGPVEEAIVAFNRTIRQEHRLEYDAMVAKYRLRQQSREAHGPSTGP